MNINYMSLTFVARNNNWWIIWVSFLTIKFLIQIVQTLMLLVD
jgi:hypothetical protein